MLKLLFLLFLMPSLLFSTVFAQKMPPIEPGVSHDLAIWRAARYSDVRYKLNLTLEKMSPVLKGTIEIRVKVSEPPASAGGATLPAIILDWRKIRGKEDSSTVANISINEKSAKYEETNEHLVFKDGIVAGENLIKLDFTSPIATSGAAITRYVDKEDGAEYVYSLFVPSDASTAFPVFDQPDLKARFSLTLKTPDNWKVVSNTPLNKIQTLPASHSEDAIKKLHETAFEETKPISTYVFAFAAGDFAEFEDTKKETISYESSDDIAKNNGIATRIYSGVPKIYVRKSQAEKFKKEAAEVFRLNREGVKFLESWFDYKFPFPKYDLVLIPEFPFGGMEHAGATFLREDRIIFPTELTKNDLITRANVIFHEAAHQWFGDCVTMKWFDDLWLKEGFAEFMAYKTLEKVMPEYNAWKIFYERNKQAAYLTDVTRGTTPIYQEIENLSAAKSAYGNIVYRKAPSFLRQAEFYFGNNKFQTAVRAFLKKYQFKNAEWQDLVKEFETVACFGHRSWTYSEGINGQRIREMKCLDESGKKTDLSKWADSWVKKRGVPIIRVKYSGAKVSSLFSKNSSGISLSSEEVFQKEFKVLQQNTLGENNLLEQEFNVSLKYKKGNSSFGVSIKSNEKSSVLRVSELAAIDAVSNNDRESPVFIFPNYGDYGYGIFLLDEKSRAYVLANIQNEKDDFLRSMMWGSLWDSVRFYELAPEDYVKLVIKNINVESDESTIQTLLGRVSTAINYYLSDKQRDELAPQLEAALIDKMQTAPTLGQRITFYRAFLNVASSEKARVVLKDILSGKLKVKELNLKAKDKFDLVTRLIVLGDKDALNILAAPEKQNTDDAAKRYAYAARAGIPTAENKLKYWQDFTNNKEISESYIESAFNVWNTPRQADSTLPYLEKALAELPNLKKNRKIFFVNGWLSAFIGGQKSVEALNVINKFLADNPKLDKDLRNKILENSDNLERAVKIRAKFDQK